MTTATTTTTTSSSKGGSGGGKGGGGSEVIINKSGISSGSSHTKKVDVTLKIAQLQNLCKRDPIGYREDYDAQIRRLESECGILQLNPQASPSSRLIELIQFAAAVSSSSYKGDESDRIAQMIINLLMGEKPQGATATAAGPNTTTIIASTEMTMPTLALQLHREVRKTCVSALVLMRNKGAIEPLRILELFFRLMAVVPDKGLRELLYKHMVNDIRNINKKGKRDDKVNRSIQSYLHRIVSNHGQQQDSAGTGGTDGGGAAGEESATDIAAKRATDLVCELYRRQVWTDDRAVAILASAIQSKNTTVMARSMRFFLNIEEKMAEDQKMVNDEEWDAAQKINMHRFSKKTCSRQRHVERQLKNRQKQQRKREGKDTDEWMDIRDDQGVEASKKLYPAIELLRDPQGLAEHVLKRLKSPKSSIPFRIKLLMMNFVTRLVGNHELLLLNLYPYLQKYMGGHQREVTAILAYTVQACHVDVPPDEVYGILKTIAHNFITDRCSEEQMAVGINAVRAICARVPSVLSLEESAESTGSAAFDVEAYVRDIAAYSNHRNRSVGIAGKSFMNFIRETYPTLLQGKSRGLKGSALHRANAKPLRYGEKKVAGGVEGADLLAEYEAKKAAYLKKKNKQNPNAGKDDDDNFDGFEEVEDDDEEEEEEAMAMGSDSEEEAPDLVLLDNQEDGDDDDAKGEEDDEEEEDDDDDDEEVAEEEEEDDDNDEEEEQNEEDDAKEKVKESKEKNGNNNDDDESEILDLSKMTPEEREKLKQQVSSTRIFSAEDFVKMRKLVEREERAKRDPREAARRKRAIARGEEFDELSVDSDGSGGGGSDDDDDDKDKVRIKGAVNPNDIMAEAMRKRQSKAERLQKVLDGRQKFETKERAGGSTNTEKQRKKNFLMSKSSKVARSKGRGKGGLAPKGGVPKKRKQVKQQIGHEAKKRRRKS